MASNLTVQIKEESPSTPERQSRQRAEDIRHTGLQHQKLGRGTQQDGLATVVKEEDVDQVVAPSKHEEGLHDAMLHLTQAIDLINPKSTREELGQESSVARMRIATDLTKSLADIGLLLRK